MEPAPREGFTFKRFRNTGDLVGSRYIPASEIEPMIRLT